MYFRLNLICLLQFSRFGLLFVNKSELERPLVPSKVAKTSLKLHFGTIPARNSPIVILRLPQSSFARVVTDLGNGKHSLKESRNAPAPHLSRFAPEVYIDLSSITLLDYGRKYLYYRENEKQISK